MYLNIVSLFLCLCSVATAAAAAGAKPIEASSLSSNHHHSSSFGMPPLNSRATRQLVKRRNVIPGPRSLHRGIHFHENESFVTSYKQNTKAKRNDHRELLVHHQKINEELQDVYARTAALHGENATMEERIEESWLRFERIGGKRPPGATPAA
ncbi:hypothetical protein DQ04_07401000, partial [Trypanosoma grayi]|uniref:hypothetical protein n=1 Tax=Trypanosoma grayi TaxID=71804 RepID=UPI0004F412B0